MCDNRYIVYEKDKSYTLKDGTKIRLGEDLGVPCGRCPTCRKTLGMQWAFRLQQELLISKTAWFVTLTYNTSNVPLIGKQMTLKMKDLSLFFKRLRKHEKFKYFAIGEYGETRYRPHYHLLIFGLDNTDNIAKAWNGGDTEGAERIHTPEGGNPHIQRHEPIERGTIHIGEVTLPSIIYCVDYMFKKKIIPQYPGDLRQKEFSNKSNGLGMNYIYKNYQYHKSDLSRNYVEIGKIKIPMPRIYREYVYTEKERIDQKMLFAEDRRERLTEQKTMLKEIYPEKDISWLKDQAKMARHIRQNKQSNKKLRDASNNKKELRPKCR